MKNKILLTAVLVMSGFAVNASAGVPTITLGGYLDTEYGFVSERKEFREQYPDDGGEIRRNHALVNDTKIMVRADGKLEHMVGAKYGAMIKLNADTSDGNYNDKHGIVITLSADTPDGNYNDNKRAQQTMAYFEGPFGRIEAGSYTGASHALHVSATQLGKGSITGIDATGGMDGDWWQWINPLDENWGPIREEFILVPQLYTNNIAAVGIEGVNASKITYFTPEYKGFRGGISYVPDLESHGTVSEAMSLSKYESNDQLGVYRDIIEGGVHYEGKVSVFNVKAGLVGEVGTSKKYCDMECRRLLAWEAGVAVQRGNWTVAGAYGDLGKTAQFTDSEAIQSKYWNVGVAYEHGPFGVSLTYADTESGLFSRDKGSVNIFAAGADWKLAKGVKLYTDLAHFQAKKAELQLNNKGAIVRVGSLVHF